MKIRGTRFIQNVVQPHPIVTNLPPTNTCEKEWYLPVSVTVYFDLNHNTVAGGVPGEPEARRGEEEGGGGTEDKPRKQPNTRTESLS